MVFHINVFYINNVAVALRYISYFIRRSLPGILCLLLAILMIFMDLRYPNTLSTFLGTDPLGQYDECLMRKHTKSYILIMEYPGGAPLLKHPVETLKRRFILIDRKLPTGRCAAQESSCGWYNRNGIDVQFLAKRWKHGNGKRQYSKYSTYGVDS